MEVIDMKMNEINNQDEEILNVIKMDADSIEVPESLKPENIKRMLDESRSYAKPVNNKARRNKKIMYKRIATFVAAAAAVAVVTVTAFAVSKNLGIKKASDNMANSASVRKTYIGDSYKVAASYDDIYKKIYKQDYRTNGLVYEEEKADDSSHAGVNTNGINATDTAQESGGKEYSKTNTMVESIDEADTVKINDKYLYILKGSAIEIIDISGNTMNVAGRVDLNSIDSVSDFYLVDDKLYIIGTKSNISILNTVYNMFDTRHYYSSRLEQTVLCSVDVSSPEKPEFIGTLTQDGDYYSSRRAGDTMYLFTQKDIYTNEADMIPTVNGEKMNVEDIYISSRDYVYQSLIITSIDLKEPDKAIDQIALMDEAINIYMGENSIYLYSNSYSRNTGNQETDIIKIDYKDGVINPVDAGRTRGYVTDKFALSEKKGRLRILTTVSDNREDSGMLTVFDENMNRVSSITGIAPGERIYAARYIGDVVYFVTYRNMDPLFAVDLRDDTNPKILGFIEMTGYSDYLHPYGNNLLLGIGYETDPETNRNLGIKLTMFDISDPTKIKIIDSVVMKDATSTTALNDYKQVLADSDKNVIGLLVRTKTGNDYRIFSFKDNHFVSEMNYDVDKSSTYSNRYRYSIRGLYSGNMLYLVDGTQKVIAFDMNNKYNMVGEISLY